MATQVSALPAIGFNPAICPEDLHDMETSFRYVFNYMLDADENDRHVRDAGREIIFDFLAKLGQPGKKAQKVLREFAARTAELFESARNQSQIRAMSAKCLVEMWAERMQVYTPVFQGVFYAIRRMGWHFPRPDLFEAGCFKTLVSHPITPRFAFLWPGLYGRAPNMGGRKR